jgi:hypothetical protein
MIRTVITGEKNGKAVFVFDGICRHARDYASTPGFATALAWATPHTAQLPHDGEDPCPAQVSVVPAPHGTRMIFVQFPPDSVMASADFDPAAAGAEYAKHLPGLAECFEPDGSGMHRTNSVDYDVIVSGELWLELDDGEVRHVKAGDVVIQNGTRHAWRNRSDTAATMVSVLVGADRAQPASA